MLKDKAQVKWFETVYRNGLRVSVIAERLGITEIQVRSLARALGTPRTKRTLVRLNEKTVERNAAIVRARATKTLDSVGQEFGLSRERVRQIVRDWPALAKRVKEELESKT